MTITLDPYNDCDCCGHGSDIYFGGPSVPLIVINCLTGSKCNLSVPRYWELVAPALNNVCTMGLQTPLCQNWGGTFILEHAATAGISGSPIGSEDPECTWVSPAFTATVSQSGGLIRCVNGTQARYLFTLASPLSTTVNLTHKGAGGATGVSSSYRMLMVDFDCEGPNTFNHFTSQTTACNGFPASLTITPSMGP